MKHKQDGRKVEKQIQQPAIGVTYGNLNGN